MPMLAAIPGIVAGVGTALTATSTIAAIAGAAGAAASLGMGIHGTIKSQDEPEFGTPEFGTLALPDSQQGLRTTMGQQLGKEMRGPTSFDSPISASGLQPLDFITTPSQQRRFQERHQFLG